MPGVSSISQENLNTIKNRYLDSDKRFDVRTHLEQLEKEEKSGLKGIEVRSLPKQLGKDDFLKLLLTQLSQQDPTNPMKDQDFIAQMAQFSSLEQMKNISTGISKMESRQNFALVGKLISGPDMNDGDTIVGVVGAIFFDGDGKSFARVNGRTVEVDKITLVSDPNIVNENEMRNNVKSEQEWTHPGSKKSNYNSK
jgi:flagellar basal-body rod modification protein FlgD